MKYPKNLNKDILNKKNAYKTLFKKIDDIRKNKHKLRQIGYYDPNRIKLRFIYIRYADDWIILTNAPISILNRIKKDIADWLQTKRKAKLSLEKTLATDLRKETGHFLGFELKNTNTRRLSYQKDGKLKRTAGWTITCSPDKQRLINRSYMKGYCEKNGWPREISWLSTLDSYTIVQKYNSVMEGFSNFYAEFVTYPSSLNRWLYIYRWSALKTLAQKYKTNLTGIYNRFGKEVTIKIDCRLPNKKIFIKSITLYDAKTIIKKALDIKQKRRIDTQLLLIEKGGVVDYESQNKQRTPRILDINFLDKINWVNFRTQANLGLPCALCGNPESQMHHIRHIRKTKFDEINPQDSIGRGMFFRNRKQVPLCEDCHMNKVHKGIYNGPGLRSLFPKNFDNRILNSESYVIPGTPYQGKNLENNLKDKGWTEIKEDKK